MRKIIPILLLIAFPVTSRAQLEVTANGKAYIQHDYIDGHASLTVGESPYIDYDFLGDMAIHAHKFGTLQGKDAIAVYGEAGKTTTSGHPIGVMGMGWGPLNTPSYGVLGTIPIGYIGAAVCGTTEGAAPPHDSVGGSYAGFFYGDTYVDAGYLTAAYGFYNLSDIRLKTNIVPLRKLSEERGSVVDGLSSLEVIEYNLKSPSQHNEAAKEDKKRGPDAALAEKRAEERATRRHYGVSAQELQKLYPGLVAEGQDGYLTVNYTEMVPLLLRCIQELKDETDSLKKEVRQLKSANESRTATMDDDEEEVPELAVHP